MNLTIPSNALLQTLLDLFLACGIGLLIGIEREFAHRDEKAVFAGVRTFVLVVLFGYLCALLTLNGSVALIVAGLIAVSGLAITSYILSAQRGDPGSTTEYAVLAAYILGILVQRGEAFVAVSAAVIITFLLSLKLEFKSLVAKLGREDIRAALKLLLVSALLLPILPDKAFDPYAVLNPLEIWTVVVLVLGINFLGFFAVKFWSARRGIQLTGFFGGFASSTVVTWVFSNRSSEDQENSEAYAVGVLLALIVMFFRVILLAALINSALALKLLTPILIMLVGLIVVAWFFSRKILQGEEQQTSTFVKNPFNLPEALRFAAIYTAIIFLVSFAEQNFGQEGIYLTSLVAGFADVDAINMSMARLAGVKLDANVALIAIIIAVLSNNLTKFGIAMFCGSQRFKRVVSWGLGSAVILGLLSLLYYLR